MAGNAENGVFVRFLLVCGILSAKAVTTSVKMFGSQSGSCTPAGYSMRYPTVYDLSVVNPDHLGVYHGYDSSDPRFRFGVQAGPRYEGLVPGGYATVVPGTNTDGTRPGSLILAGKHIAMEDQVYYNCLGVQAVVDLTAACHFNEEHAFCARWDQPGMYPDLVPRASFVHYGLVFTQADSFRMPQKDWIEHFTGTGYNGGRMITATTTEDFIDTKLAAGENVLIYDEEGCEGSAAVAIAYILKKNPTMTYDDAYNSLHDERTCVEDLLAYPGWEDKLRSLAPR